MPSHTSLLMPSAQKPLDNTAPPQVSYGAAQSPFIEGLSCIFKRIGLLVRHLDDKQIEGITRHFSMAAESLHEDIPQITGGHADIRRELQDLRLEFRDEFKELRRSCAALFHNSTDGFTIGELMSPC